VTKWKWKVHSRGLWQRKFKVTKVEMEGALWKILQKEVLDKVEMESTLWKVLTKEV